MTSVPTTVPGLDIIVPMYNEAETLDEFLSQLRQAADEITETRGLSVQVIFVDDGSTDGSADILRKTDLGEHRMRLIRFSRNFGKESALTAGLAASTDSDLTVMIDSDLEQPPKLMLRLLETQAETGADSVFFVKDNRKTREGRAKTLMTNTFYGILNRGARFEILKDASDFRLMTRRFVTTLQNMPENQRFMKGLYGWVGFHQVPLPFNQGVRDTGETKFPPFHLFLLAIDGLTSFTTTPLRWMMLGGLSIAVLSALYGLYIIVERIFFEPIQPGLASVLTLIAFFGGVQLLCLGLIGEYVGRVLAEAKRRPAYIVAEDTKL